MKKFVLFLLSSLLIFSITIYYRLGAYKSVNIEVAEQKELLLLFKNHLGPYHKINSTIHEVEVWAALNHIPCPYTFGEYLDDPRTVDERRLRSLGGCVLTQSLQNFKNDDFFYKSIPAQKYVIAKFNGAPSIGPLKVYPKVEQYIKDHQLKVTGETFEIYKIISDREANTEYLFPLQAQ